MTLTTPPPSSLATTEHRPDPSTADLDDVTAVPKVLYVLKRYPQLSQTFVVRELLELEAIGVDVAIDALGPQSSGPQHPEIQRVRAEVRYLPRRPALRDPGVRGVHLRLALRRPLVWTRLALAARHGDRRRFAQAGLVADRARREGRTHLHAHFATAAADVARDAAALAGITFSVTAHAKDVFHHEHAPHLPRRVHGASAVVTVSAFNERHLHEVLPGTPVVHVPNGVALADHTGSTPGGPVLCVARLVAKKGVDTLLEALALLGDRTQQLRLEIAGDGELRGELEERVQHLGLTDRVTFLGSVSSVEVQAAYRRASVLALPCRIDADGDRDGMPTVILEAMAAGLPVVSTDVIGIPEVVRDGSTGLLVPPDDPAALAAAIERLWSDPALACALGDRGRELVAERFAPRRSAVALARVFAAASGDIATDAGVIEDRSA